MIATNQRVKIIEGDFQGMTGRVVGQSIAGEHIVEIAEKGNQCVHFPDTQLQRIGAVDGTVTVEPDVKSAEVIAGAGVSGAK